MLCLPVALHDLLPPSGCLLAQLTLRPLPQTALLGPPVTTQVSTDASPWETRKTRVPPLLASSWTQKLGGSEIEKHLPLCAVLVHLLRTPFLTQLVNMANGHAVAGRGLLHLDEGHNGHLKLCQPRPGTTSQKRQVITLGSLTPRQDHLRKVELDDDVALIIFNFYRCGLMAGNLGILVLSLQLFQECFHLWDLRNRLVRLFHREPWRCLPHPDSPAAPTPNPTCIGSTSAPSGVRASMERLMRWIRI